LQGDPPQNKRVTPFRKKEAKPLILVFNFQHAIVQLEHHKKLPRGYIGMLSVNPAFRRMGIGRHLVALAVDSIRAAGSLEVSTRAPSAPSKLR
jgi:ribosomal protein S18 acetylase RimI-like enzyme